MTILMIVIIATAILTLFELGMGFLRGLKKSVTRSFFILGCGVVAFTVSVAFSEAITCAVLSAFGLEGSDFSSLTSNLISRASLDEASTNALSSDISLFLDSVIKPLFFLIIYWVLKFLTWIAYLIITKVSAKKDEAKTSPDVKSRCLGMSVGLGIAAFTLVPVIILTTTPVFKLVDAANDVITLIDAKPPETADDYVQTLSTTRIVVDKVVDSGAISEQTLITTVTCVIDKFIDNLSGAVDLSAIKITYTSVDEINADLKTLEEIILWFDENGIFGAFMGNNSDTTGLVEKLDEVLVQLEKLSFGKQVCDAFANAFVKELFGETGAEILNEVADSEEIREVVVQIADIAPIINEIDSGNLTPESPEVKEELDRFAEEFELPEGISDEDVDTLIDGVTDMLSEYGVSEEDILKYAELLKN